MKKRILSILLSLAMFVSVMPMSVFATEAEPQPAICSCETKCTAEAILAECALCGAENADLAVCIGAEPQQEEPVEQPTEQPTQPQQLMYGIAPVDDTVTSYNVWVGGVQVTSANKGDITAAINAATPNAASGTATLTVVEHENASPSYVLTLSNFKYSGDGYNFAYNDYAAVYSKGDTVIKLTGDNTISSTKDGSGSSDCAIYVDGELTITDDTEDKTDSTLNATSKKSNAISGERKIIIGNVKVNATSDNGCGMYSNGGSISISNAIVTAICNGGNKGIYGYKGVTIENSNVVTKSTTGVALFSAGGHIGISNSTVEAIGGSNGIGSIKNIIIAGNSNVTATSTADHAFGKKPILDGTYKVSAGTSASDAVDADPTTDATYTNNKYVKIEVIEYPVWVGGVQVTSANKDDITTAINAITPNAASGKATLTVDVVENNGGFPERKFTLVLDGFTYIEETPITNDPDDKSDDAAIVSDVALDIVVNGTNTISGTNCIAAYKNLNIKGKNKYNDKLIINYSGAEDALIWGIIAGDKAKFADVNISITATDEYCGPAIGVLNGFETSNTIIDVKTNESQSGSIGGILAYEEIKFEDSKVTVNWDTYNESEARYNAAIVTTHQIIIEDSEVYARSTGKSDSSDYGSYGIVWNTKPIPSGGPGNGEATSAFISVKNSTVTAIGTTAAYYDCKVSNLEGSLDNLAVYAGDSAEGAEEKTKDKDKKETYTTNQYVKIEPLIKYPVWVGGEQVTSHNFSANGWNYNYATNTLTLDGATISNGYAVDGDAASIYCEGDLNVVLENSNTINGAQYGFFVADGDLVISGSGSLDLTAEYDGVQVTNGGVTIDADDVSINGVWSYGIKAESGDVNLDGNFVNIKGGVNGSGIVCKTITLGKNVHTKITHGSVAIVSTDNVVTEEKTGGWFCYSENSSFERKEQSVEAYFEYMGCNHVVYTANEQHKHIVSCEHDISFTEPHKLNADTYKCDFCGEEYALPTNFTATYGETLADVTLPAGWVWKDPTTTSVGDVGSNKFTVIFAPEGATNYDTVEAEITIIVETKPTATPTPAPSAAPTTKPTTTPAPTATPEPEGEVVVKDKDGVLGFGGVLVQTADELTQILVSEEDKKLLEEGKDIIIFLENTDISTSVTEEEKQLIAEAVSGVENAQVGVYLDINLFKQVGNNDPEKITNTDAPIVISVEIPQQLIPTEKNIQRTYYIVRVHDGQTDIIEGEFDPATGIFTFETDKFSTYTIIYTDVVTEAPEPAPQQASFPWWIVVAAAAVVTVTGVVIAKKKHSEE